MSQTPAGWYPDANGTVRWWDGVQWTEHTQPPPARPVEQPAPRTETTAPLPTFPPPTTQPSASPPPGPSPASLYGMGPAGFPGYSEWPGSTTPKRTVPIWLVVAVGLVVLLVVVGLVLLVTRGGDHTTSSQTSSQRFCSALEALPRDATLTDATAAIEATGLPSDIPANAKRGFDLYARYAPQLLDGADLSPAQKAQLVGGPANLADMKAFDTYVDQTCGAAAP